MMTQPLGVNNLNQLVEQQLGNTGYEVVRCIYNNINWLYSTYEQLPLIGNIQQTIPYVQLLSQHIDTVSVLVQHLDVVKNLDSNLPLVQELAPRIQAFKTSLDKYQEVIKENNHKIERLDEIYLNGEIQLRQLTSELKSFVKRTKLELRAEFSKEADELLANTKKLSKETLAQYNDLVANKQLLTKYLTTATENHQMLKHLMASDAVNTYLWEQTEAHKQKALKAIREAERAGNSEVTNRHKMKATKPDLNLFKVLNRNNLELANKTVGGR